MIKRNIILSLSILIISIGLQSCTLSFQQPGTTTPIVKAPADDSQEIIKSPSDEREYRYLVLDNGLKALLISDPKTDKAAASLDVNVGSFANPENRLGLAHFLEHMLFLGTEKYPEVGEYSKFLKQHGGSSNAYTRDQNTNYYFDVNKEQIEPALDRFSQFFTTPLLDPTYVDKERNAVESEYRLKIKDTGWRQYAIEQNTVNPQHPYSKFIVGSLDTLVNDKENSLVTDLKDFYNKYYNARHMGLVVLASQPLDSIEQMIRPRFSMIQSSVNERFKVETPLLLDEHQGVRIHVKPLKTIRQLELQFAVADQRPHYLNKKPLSFISQYIDHEGKGSLHYYLKKQGWAENVGAYTQNIEPHTMFNITVSLTEEGAKHIDEITQATFQYIALIKDNGINEKFFNEMKQINDQQFQFKTSPRPQSYVTSLAANMQDYPARDLLHLAYNLKDFDADLIARYLSELAPQHMRQIITMPDIETNLVDPYFNTPYSINKLGQDKLTYYQTKKELALSLPPANAYIASDLTISPNEKVEDSPQAVHSNEYIRFWHQQDGEFKKPKASMDVQIYSAAPNRDAKHRMLNALYAGMINESLEPQGYAAQLAGLGYSVSATNYGLYFNITGFNQKQSTWFQTMCQNITTPSFTKQDFQLYQQSIIKNLKNSFKDRPISQVIGVRGDIVRRRDTNQEVLRTVEQLSLNDLKNYIPLFWKHIYIEGLSYGNMTQSDAILFAKHLQGCFAQHAKQHTPHVIKISRITDQQRLVQQIDVDHNDSSIVVTIQGQEDNEKLRATYGLIGQIIGQAFYKSLRTDQQLGYVVQANAISMDRLPGLWLLAQSPKADPLVLEDRINVFLDKQRERLKKLGPEELETHKQAVITNIMYRELSIGQRTSRYWSELNSNYPQFNSRKIRVDTINKITLDDILKVYQRDIVGNKTSRLVVRSFGKKHQKGKAWENTLKDPNVCRKEKCFDDLPVFTRPKLTTIAPKTMN